VLYVDIPAPSDISALATFRGEGCVSIYLRTTPVTPQAQADPIELKNLARLAAEQLQAGETDKKSCAAIAEQLDDLVDDNAFWRFQAHSLAIFVTPQNLRSFPLPNALQLLVIVSDRFHVKPLLRSVSFPQSCYVLALAQKSVRIVEVSPDLPSTAIHVEGMPEDAGRAVQGAGEASDWPRSPRPHCGPAPVLEARAAIRRAGAFRPLRGRRCCCANLPAKLTRRCGRWSPEAAFRWCWQRPCHVDSFGGRHYVAPRSGYTTAGSGVDNCASLNERRQAARSSGTPWRRDRQGAGGACPEAAGGRRSLGSAAGARSRRSHRYRARGRDRGRDRPRLGDRSMARYAAVGDDSAVFSGCRCGHAKRLQRGHRHQWPRRLPQKRQSRRRLEERVG